MTRLPILLIALVSIIAVACNGDGDDTVNPGMLTPNGEGPTATEDSITAIRGNSELVVGPNRFALALIGEDNRPILDEDVLFRFFVDGELQFEVDAGFTYAIPDANGFYIAQVDFDTPGEWSVEAVLTRNGTQETASLLLVVSEESVSPNVGDPAPASEHLTLATEPNLTRLTTDEDPDPALYETTIAEAVTLGRPAVIVFATPAFCQTRFCGPVVENIRDVREDYTNSVTFIHIEPFELGDDGGLVSAEGGGPVVVPAMLEWNLQTEPWVYVLDANGVVAARFEGAASPQELDAVLRGLVG